MSVIAYDESVAPTPDDESFVSSRPTRHEAEEAVRTLIRWAGDDPKREGLLDTPKRVAKAYEDWYRGYKQDPEEVLARVFEEVEDYDDIVLLNDVRLESMCEHHLAPIIGKASIAYLPDKRVIGISKLARLLDIYGKRMQVQEKLTAQVADTLQKVLQPKGVAILLEAEHHCMSTRGVHKPGVTTVTTRFTGAFKDDPKLEERFLRLCGK